MNGENTVRGKQLIRRGLAALMVTLLIFSLTVAPVIDKFRTDIDKFLGTSSTMLVSDDEAAQQNAYTWQTDYKSTKELVQAIADLGERMSEEGSVLLKNNGALPLTENEKQMLSLLGYSSYYPVMGGDMGSMLFVNTGTDADTVDFVQALEAKGFSINPSLQELYLTDSLYDEYPNEKQRLGNIQAPYTSAVFSSKEPSQTMMEKTKAGWKDTLADYPILLVTLARSSGENRTYYPGENGVNTSQNLNQSDPLGLSDDERDLLQAAAEAKRQSDGKLIVLLNNANVMEIEELKQNTDIDAILQIGLPGGYGFYGVADILSGEVNPSGHLADTYAVKNASSPAAQNYGIYEYTNSDSKNCINSVLVEAESIYTGYRYYETRYMDWVRNAGSARSSIGSIDGNEWQYSKEVSYPFGFGLSYTEFEMSFDSLQVDLEQKTAVAVVSVKNTGETAGKSAVQLYVSVPYTEYDIEHHVEKSGVQLLDYAKTKLLVPGESETITITADLQYMASWDSEADNAAGTKGCYILDDGSYFFTIADDVHEAANNVLAAQDFGIEDGMTGTGDTALVQTWVLGTLDTNTFAYSKNHTPVENQLQDMDLNAWLPGAVTYLSRNDWEGTWPKTYSGITATDEMMAILDNDTYEITDNGNPQSVVFGADNGLTLADLRGNRDIADPLWNSLMDQLSLEEAMIRVAFGGVSTKVMESIHSPEAVQNDGPNGIYSYPLGQYANYDAGSGDPCAVSEGDPNLNYKSGVMPNETVIAQTFSKELNYEYGKLMGNYSLWANLPIWWGCGVNYHRSVYNGRNHEYYSEDPVLTAFQGAELVAGGLEYGLLIAPKHYAFNDTEINRIGISTFMTEQQAREGDLRSAQKAVEDVGALAVMTSFNRVGITPSNSHTGLMINILRGEWGFEGLISEDAIPQAVYCVLKEAVMNGVTMTCKTGDNTLEAVGEKWSYWKIDNISRDERLLKALKQDMKWQAFALANSNAMDGMTSTSRLVQVRTWYDNLLTGLQILFAVLSVLSISWYVASLKSKSFVKKD